MRLLKGTLAIAVSLGVVFIVTALLWYAKRAGVGPHHPVFFYLLPIALVAVLCGSATALLCAVAATMCSAYFLYDPTYSFYVSNTLEWGDLICFAVLAVIGIKCTVDLLRPVVKIPAANAVTDRPESRV